MRIWPIYKNTVKLELLIKFCLFRQCNVYMYLHSWHIQSDNNVTKL